MATIWIQFLSSTYTAHTFKHGTKSPDSHIIKANTKKIPKIKILNYILNSTTP